MAFSAKTLGMRPRGMYHLQVTMDGVHLREKMYFCKLPSNHCDNAEGKEQNTSQQQAGLV